MNKELGLFIILERKNEEITQMLINASAKSYQVDAVEYKDLLENEVRAKYSKKGYDYWPPNYNEEE